MSYKLIYLNENAQEKASNIQIKHPGEMTEWCKRQGYEKVTCDCLCKAFKSDNPILHKRANFAYNFGWKRHNKTCDCVEKLRNSKK